MGGRWQNAHIPMADDRPIEPTIPPNKFSN